jgi:hypothetical protein
VCGLSKKEYGIKKSGKILQKIQVEHVHNIYYQENKELVRTLILIKIK